MEQVQNKNQDQKAEIQNSTGEQKPKKRSCFKTCCVISIVIFILFLFGATAALASTGLVQIPIFSSLFYKPPTPVREVKPDTQAKDKLKIQLEENVKQGKNNFEIELTEGMLTQLVQEKKDFNFTDSQIAINPNEVEFFGKLKSKKLYLTCALKLIEKDGKPDFLLSRAKLGNVPIWVGLINAFTEGLQEQLTTSLLNFGGDFQIKKAYLSQGKIIASVEFTKELGPGENQNDIDINFEPTN